MLVLLYISFYIETKYIFFHFALLHIQNYLYSLWRRFFSAKLMQQMQKKKRIFHFNFKYDVLLSRLSNEFLHGLKRNHLVFLRKILYLPAVLLLSALSIHNVAYNHVLFEFEEKPNVVCSRIYIMAVIYCVNINAHPPHEQHFLFKQ